MSPQDRLRDLLEEIELADQVRLEVRSDFDVQCQLHGAFDVGSPQQVAEKILWQHERFGHDRFLLQLTVGTMPHADVMRAIELFGTEVAPTVRDHQG